MTDRPRCDAPPVAVAGAAACCEAAPATRVAAGAETGAMGTPGPQNGAPADEESSPLASLWRQARAETASADKRARQGAQPLPANGNGQHGQRGVQPASPTSSTDVPRRTERRDMDVRIAWRDAELFRLSKREQQWKCALVMLCWRMQAAQLAARNLAVFRFLQRRRQAGCKAHLLAWWAVVLLQQRPFPSSPLGGASDGSGEEDAAASCNANGKAKLRALQRQSSDTLAGRANAAEPAYPHGQAAEGVTAPAEEADALGQQAADLKIIQRCVQRNRAVRAGASASGRAKRWILFRMRALFSAPMFAPPAQLPAATLSTGVCVQTKCTNACVRMRACLFLSGMWGPCSRSWQQRTCERTLQSKSVND